VLHLWAVCEPLQAGRSEYGAVDYRAAC
jgi:hypothetical protein